MRRIIWLLLAIISFSSVGTLRVLASSWPSEIIALVRMGGAALIFSFILFSKKNRQPVKGMKDWAEISAIGIIIAVVFLLLLQAFEEAPVSSIKPISFIEPVIVLGLSVVFLKERVGLAALLAAVFAMGGLSLIIDWNFEMREAGGVWLAAIAMVFMAIGTIIIKKVEMDVSIIDVLFYPFIIGFFALLLWVAINPPEMEGMDYSQWPYVALMAILTAIAFFAYDEAVYYLGAHVSALAINGGVAVIGSLMAVYFVSDNMHALWLPSVFLFIVSGALIYVDSVQNERAEYKKLHH
ncbi:hypothetical protein COU37_01440 [Candidatus Micrarchaeota archaeon CG10_big_fil_rev_8_21_14_0_10_45_29]|nr:MAG: hypothetical protein COU37_01440 [Candidatus Micrarchaeota archaeon CG10_big_fil_rev_8_21_14_0_10_45_29]